MWEKMLRNCKAIKWEQHSFCPHYRPFLASFCHLLSLPLWAPLPSNICLLLPLLLSSQTPALWPLPHSPPTSLTTIHQKFSFHKIFYSTESSLTKDIKGSSSVMQQVFMKSVLHNRPSLVHTHSLAFLQKHAVVWFHLMLLTSWFEIYSNNKKFLKNQNQLDLKISLQMHV